MALLLFRETENFHAVQSEGKWFGGLIEAASLSQIKQQSSNTRDEVHAPGVVRGRLAEAARESPADIRNCTIITSGRAAAAAHRRVDITRAAIV